MGFFVVKTTLNQRFLSILFVGFLAANRFDILGVCQNDFAVCFKDIVDGNPILSRGFHAHIFAVVLSQPGSAAVQISGKGGEPLALVGGHALLIGRGDTGNNKGLVDIHPAADTINDFEHNTSPRNSVFEGTGRDWTPTERLK